jgi:hypothetical protein
VENELMRIQAKLWNACVIAGLGFTFFGCTSTPPSPQVSSQANPATQPAPTPAPVTATPVQTTQPSYALLKTSSGVTLIKCGRESAARILAGTQTSTTRKGIRHYPLGPAFMQSSDQQIPVTITDVEFTKFGDLGNAQAHNDGLPSIDALKDTLMNDYPDLQDSDEMTTIYFRVTGPAHSTTRESK